MKPVVSICFGLALLALLPCFGSFAHGFDAEQLKMRLVPRESDAVQRDVFLDVDSQLWRSDLERLEARRSRAMKVSQSYLSDNLQRWAKGGPLERVERLRRTDFKLNSSPDRMLDLSLRVSEQVRLRISTADFQRDLLYDPVDERMWVDLFQMQLPESKMGLRLTNTYRLDDDSSNLILRISRPLQ